jgi:hypothetical protein
LDSFSDELFTLVLQRRKRLAGRTEQLYGIFYKVLSQEIPILRLYC